MGNFKSKKFTFPQENLSTVAHKNHEYILPIKTDLSDPSFAITSSLKILSENEAGISVIRTIEEVDDNASNASTVEVLHDGRTKNNKEIKERNAAARSKGSKMPAQNIKLYYLPPSPPCRAVMMTARAIGLELDLNLTNIMEGQHMTPEFLKINPQHTVPTIDDNGFILWESRAILAYLVNAYGRDDSLYPKNPRLRAIVDQRLNFDIGTLFQRYLNLYIPMLFVGAPYNEELAQKLNEALGWLDIMLENKVFVAGDNLTIADISIIVTITNLDALGHDLSSYDNVMKWFERTKKVLEPYGYSEIDEAGAKILASFLKKDN